MSQEVQMESVKTLLVEKGVRCVAVIDDCFDEAGKIVRPEAVEDFYDGIVNHDDAEALLEHLAGICKQTVSSGDDIPASVITLLEKDPELRKPFGSAWMPIAQSIMTYGPGQLKPLLDCLRNDLGLEVLELGSHDDGQAENAQILFMDYYLDPGVRPEDDPSELEFSGQAMKQAIARSEGIYNSYPEDAKPVVVLMSNHPGEANEGASHFCRDANLLRGVFYFAPKDALRDPFSLAFKMRTYAMASETGHLLQKFNGRLRDEAGRVARDFAEELKSLSVNDYGYLQYFGLREDGQPLGEYLSWIFSWTLSQRLFSETLRDERLALDRVIYPTPQPLPSFADMSESLVADLYNCAVFDTCVRELGPHPAPDCGTGSDLFLKLGDVFRLGEELLMVVNPECDLAYGMEKRRPFPHELSILLLPGKLTLLSEDAEPIGGTDVICLDGGVFRITWDVRRIRAVQFDRMKKWLETNDCRLVAQMRSPHALRLQNRVARNLTRVGTPAPSPFHHRVRVRIWIPGEEEWRTDDVLEVVVVRSRRQHHLVVPEDVLLAARLALAEVIERKKGEHERSTSESKKAKLAKTIERYEEVMRSPECWYRHQDPITWPPSKKMGQLDGIPVAIVRESQSELAKQHPVVIQLLKEASQNSPSESTE